MSRTDVHRPMWVLERDPTIRHWFVEEHNHEKGPCDLDRFTFRDWRRGQRCYLNISGACPNLCGCKLCTGWPTRWQERRQERMLWREARQKALKTVAKDLEDFDEGLLRGSAAW